MYIRQSPFWLEGWGLKWGLLTEGGQIAEVRCPPTPTPTGPLLLAPLVGLWARGTWGRNKYMDGG